VGLFQGTLDIDHGQQHEDEGLDEGNQDTISIIGSGTRKGASPKKIIRTVRGRSCCRTDAGSVRPDVEMPDDLNKEHDRRQPGDRSAEVLEVVKSMMLIPTTWVERKTMMAQAAVVLILAVGGKKPGTRPIRLETI